MISSDDIQTIISGAQSAALDDSLWQGWAENIINASDSSGANFVVISKPSNLIVRSHPFIDNPKGYEEYLEGMVLHDPQWPRCISEHRCSVYTDRDHVDLTRPDTRDYMQWQYDRFRFNSHITMAMNIDADFTVGFSIHFDRPNAGMAEALRPLYGRMLPQVASAMKLGFSHSELMTKAYWEGLSAREDHRAVILLDENGRMIRCNSRAEHLLADAQMIRVKDRRLKSAAAPFDARFEVLTTRAIARISPLGGAIRLTGAIDQTKAAVAEFFPLNRARRFMALAEPAALVIITDIAPPMNVRSNWLQDIFDFTPAELRVAEWLVQGMGDDLIAHELGIAVSTARTHIKSILGKTQTRSKAELAHLLTMIVR